MMKLLLRLACLAAVILAVIKGREWYSGRGATEITPETYQFTQQFSNSLVFVEGKASVGSGFVCEISGKKFVITNQHVVAGNPGARFTLLDQSPMRTGQAAAAVGHDIMSFALLSDTKAMEMMTDVEKTAAIGDEVAVLGNADGARVIRPLMGKLLGIGPDRVEVSAEFVPGNSGSPIIHVKSGKVIGIATYATIRKIDSLTGKPKAQPEVKRFGYRLDSVRQWQPVNWPAYQGEFQTLEKIEARTNDLLRLLLSSRFVATDYSDPAIRRTLERFENAAKGGGLIKTDKLSAAKDLSVSLRTACDADLNEAQARVSYDFFRRRLGEQQRLRGEFYKVFDEVRHRLH